MLLSSISETTYYEKREKNGTSVGFYSTAVIVIAQYLTIVMRVYRDILIGVRHRFKQQGQTTGLKNRSKKQVQTTG